MNPQVSPPNEQRQQPANYQALKSPILAAILVFFFGPLGMLYVSFANAAILFLVTLVIGLFTAGIGLIFVFPISAIWAYFEADKQNKIGR